MSNQIEYCGSNFNTEVIRKWERAQFVDHLRSQFMPEISMGEIQKREAAAGELWDMFHEEKEPDADSKTTGNEVAGDAVKPSGNNRRNK